MPDFVRLLTIAVFFISYFIKTSMEGMMKLMKLKCILLFDFMVHNNFRYISCKLFAIHNSILCYWWKMKHSIYLLGEYKLRDPHYSMKRWTNVTKVVPHLRFWFWLQIFQKKTRLKYHRGQYTDYVERRQRGCQFITLGRSASEWAVCSP